MAFETENGVIRGPAFGFGIITAVGPLLFAVEGQNDGIQMEDQRGSGFGKQKKLGAKLIMQPNQLADGVGRQALQEPAQGRLVRKLFQAEQGQKETVILELVGFVDSLDADDQKEKQQDNHIDGIELRPIRGRAPETLEATAKIQFVAKSLNEEEAAVVGQTIRLERKPQ
jgi:hypothetical protein